MSDEKQNTALKFTQPINQIIMMLVLTMIVFAGGYFAYPSLSSIFLSSPYLNGIIMAVFIAGLFSCFSQVFSLIQSVIWIEAFAENRVGHKMIRAPRLMASVAALMSDEQARYALTSTSTRSLLDSVAMRLDESRELIRYIINLLIFLGLLGTFYGLAITVPAVVDTIRSLAPSEQQTGLDVFNNLMNGLEAQLGGMATAFGSSLLGLAGSLVVGLLDLFVGRGQNRYYRELEEWLSSITRITVGGGEGGSDLAGAGLFENANETMQAVQVALLDSAAQVAQVSSELHKNARQSTQQHSEMLEAMQELAVGQRRLIDVIVRMQNEGDGILDPETRMRLRNIDEGLMRLSEDFITARAQSAADLHAELNSLALKLGAKS